MIKLRDRERRKAPVFRHLLVSWSVITCACSFSCHSTRGALPASLANARLGSEFEDVVEKHLAEALGSRFPDFRLVRRDGSETTLREQLSGRTIVFYAGGPCPHTLETIAELQRNGWMHPDGEVVTILKHKNLFLLNDLTIALGKAPKVFAFRDWEQGDLQQYFHVYPLYLSLDEAGVLIKVKVGNVRPPIVWPTAKGGAS